MPLASVDHSQSEALPRGIDTQLNVRVPAELKAKLETLATQERRSLSAYVALVLRLLVSSSQHFASHPLNERKRLVLTDPFDFCNFNPSRRVYYEREFAHAAIACLRVCFKLPIVDWRINCDTDICRA